MDTAGHQQPMLHRRTQPDGARRRHVAVLFADISGFTRLVETVEPEIVYETISPLMDELVLVVKLHEGEIQQVLGDGFMSVFGLRVTRGDEAERAVRVGLALVAAGRGCLANLRVHVGIEYGEVLVTPSWQSAGFGVWGRTVTLARRLCEVAAADEIQLGPAAYAQANDRISRATPTWTRLKGITGAVVAHRVGRGESEPLAPAG